MSKVKKPAGFWIRVFARSIDLFIIALISTLLLFALTYKSNGVIKFREVYLFYFWAIFTAFLFLLFFILIPIYLTKGKTLSYILLKLEIQFNQKMSKSIISRELFFTFGWIFTILLVTAIVNHTLIFQAAEIKTGSNLNKELTNWEKTRISIAGSIATMISTIQMILAITIIPSKTKQGFHDRVADTNVLYSKRFLEVKIVVESKLIIVKPTKFHGYDLKYLGSISQNDTRW